MLLDDADPQRDAGCWKQTPRRHLRLLLNLYTIFLLTMSTVTEKDKEFVASAPPPLHSVLTILGLFVGFLQLLPSWHDIDEVATVECFTNRVFPDLISTSVLIVIRCACSILVFGTTLYSLVPANG
jgi:hypothetical protein